MGREGKGRNIKQKPLRSRRCGQDFLQRAVNVLLRMRCFILSVCNTNVHPVTHVMCAVCTADCLSVVCPVSVMRACVGACNTLLGHYYFIKLELSTRSSVQSVFILGSP